MLGVIMFFGGMESLSTHRSVNDRRGAIHVSNISLRYTDSFSIWFLPEMHLTFARLSPAQSGNAIG